MSLEILNTSGTLLTAAIVAATAIAAMVQLRHLRAGNQINAMLAIGNQFDSKEYRDAQNLVNHGFASALEDPRHRAYEVALQRDLPLPAVPEEFVRLRSAVNLIGNTYEELGILVKNGIVDKDLFLDRYSWVIARAWRQLERFLAFRRVILNSEAQWENFEYLTVISEEYMVVRSSTYPKGIRRKQLRNPWPVPPPPATA